MTKGEKIFQVVNYVIMFFIAVAVLYPFWYILVASLSDAQAVINGDVIFWMKKTTFEAYERVIHMDHFWMSYLNTFIYTIFGTALSITVTCLGAYALSKKRLMLRRFVNFFVTLTMWFNAGMIPFYLNIKSLGLLNTRIGIIVAFACSAFYVIMLRSFFESIPESLEESAKVDGASDFLIFRKIMVPLAIPSIITVSLYYAIERWNGYFWSMILLNDINKVPLQVLLKKLIVEMETLTAGDFVVSKSMNKETVIYATIIVSVIPVLIVYPYIQKFFQKGVMVGAVKG